MNLLLTPLEKSLRPGNDAEMTMEEV